MSEKQLRAAIAAAIMEMIYSTDRDRVALLQGRSQALIAIMAAEGIQWTC
jgi:hypothetical protein